MLYLSQAPYDKIPVARDSPIHITFIQSATGARTWNSTDRRRDGAARNSRNNVKTRAYVAVGLGGGVGDDGAGAWVADTARVVATSANPFERRSHQPITIIKQQQPFQPKRNERMLGNQRSAHLHIAPVYYICITARANSFFHSTARSFNSEFSVNNNAIWISF